MNLEPTPEPEPESFYPRDRVAAGFSISTRTLLRYEGLGLVRTVRQGGLEGYGPAEVRRLWTIVTFQRDLGINLAGVEVILGLLAHLGATHDHLEALADDLRAALDDPERGPPDA